MAWTFKAEQPPDARCLQFSVHDTAGPATVRDVIAALQDDAQFREAFNRVLAESPFSAFRWETPAVNHQALSQPFEFVLLDSPGLDRRPDPKAFAEHFHLAGELVTTFQNLGGDAVLVVPYPVAKDAAYGHLAAFVRKAPAQQHHALWRAVGVAMAQRIGAKPVWLSTAGAGVSWLHVRLDDRPKYYGFAPYRSLPGHESQLER